MKKILILLCTILALSQCELEEPKALVYKPCSPINSLRVADQGNYNFLATVEGINASDLKSSTWGVSRKNKPIAEGRGGNSTSFAFSSLKSGEHSFSIGYTNACGDTKGYSSSFTIPKTKPDGELLVEKIGNSENITNVSNNYRATIINQDGTIWALGYQNKEDGLSKYTVYKLNSQGDILTKKRFTNPNMTISNLVPTSDGGCIAIGNLVVTGYYAVAIKINADGVSTPWGERFYGTGNYIDLFAGTQTSDGGFVLVGQFDKTNKSSSSCYVLKIDRNGNYIKDEIFGFAIQYDAAFAVQELPDKRLIVGGRLYTNDLGRYQGWWFVLNSNLTSTSLRKFYSNYAYINRINIIDNTQALATGEKFATNQAENYDVLWNSFSLQNATFGQDLWNQQLYWYLSAQTGVYNNKISVLNIRDEVITLNAKTGTILETNTNILKGFAKTLLIDKNYNLYGLGYIFENDLTKPYFAIIN